MNETMLARLRALLARRAAERPAQAAASRFGSPLLDLGLAAGAALATAGLILLVLR